MADLPRAMSIAPTERTGYRYIKAAARRGDIPPRGGFLHPFPRSVALGAAQCQEFPR